MTTHQGVTIADADQLFDLLRDGSAFHDCIFDNAELELENCSARRADFAGLECQTLRIVDSTLGEALFDKADIQEAEFLNSNLTSARFRNARLNLSRLVDCDLSLCNFDGANFDSLVKSLCRSN